MTLQRTPAADYAAANPPLCLNGFDASPRSLAENDRDLAVIFDLKCKTCQADVFSILCYPKAAPDPSPYAEVEPGQIFHRPPLRLRCEACETVAPLLDIRVHGYDAVLNNVANYESAEDGEEEAPVPGHFRVAVDFCYNIDLEELQELASEVDARPSDLFDWISVEGKPIGVGEPFSVGFECA